MSTDGLAALSGLFGAEATASDLDPTPLSYSAFRHTASAVKDVHPAVPDVGRRISNRLASAGGLVANAEAAYDSQDHDAAARILDGRQPIDADRQ